MSLIRLAKCAALAAVATCAAALPLLADTAATEAFADARMANFGAGSIDKLMAQYAPDAVIITPQGALTGSDQIGGMIAGIVGEFGQPGASFTLISQVAAGDAVEFTWKAETAAHHYGYAAETYVLKDGLIVYQTFAADMSAK